MLWKKEERSRVRAVQMDDLRRLLGIKELCREKKGLDKRIDEGVPVVQPCGENGEGQDCQESL